MKLIIRTQRQWPRRVYFVSLLALMSVGVACNSTPDKNAQPAAAGNPADSIGIGPVKSKIVLPSTVDAPMATQGKALFEARCTACHKIETKYVGPALANVTKRRRPEWIMNMILNPGEMTQKDETAKDLLATFSAQMANQNLTQDEARAVLEFFRKNDSK